VGALRALKVLAVDGTSVGQVPAQLLTGCAALHTLSMHGCGRLHRPARRIVR
jgi:hypothetical protein